MPPLIMFRLVVACLLFLFGSPASAAELKGKVTGVTDRQVRISVEGELLPQVGDEVAISFQLPGGPLLRVGTWKVSEVQPDFVEATLVEATGKPTVDQIATINSPNPTRRSAPAAPSAKPGVRGFIGVAMRDVTEADRKASGAESGVFAVAVAPGSPAERAGLKQGDVILSLNGKPVAMQELRKSVAASTPGQTVVLRVLRAGETRDFNVTVGSLPQQAGEPAFQPARAKLRYHGKIYDTYHRRIVVKDQPVDYYFFETPPAGDVPAVVNGKQLQNQFMRVPAADHPDQSKVNWTLSQFIYENGRWELDFTDHVTVEVLDRDDGPPKKR